MLRATAAPSAFSEGQLRRPVKAQTRICPETDCPRGVPSRVATTSWPCRPTNHPSLGRARPFVVPTRRNSAGPCRRSTGVPGRRDRLRETAGDGAKGVRSALLTIERCRPTDNQGGWLRWRFVEVLEVAGGFEFQDFVAARVISGFGCPSASSESRQMGLLGRAQEATAAGGCPSDFEQAVPVESSGD